MAIGPIAPKKKHNIIVFGAGVIGLQTALTLLQASYPVTILANKTPDQDGAMDDQSWASPWAGAQWRAHAQANSEAAQWESRTYAVWSEIVASEAKAGYGPGQGPSSLAALPFQSFWNAGTKPATRPPWWASLSPDTFYELHASRLPPDAVYGTSMQSFTLHPSAYLKYLLDQVRSLGGQIVHKLLRPASDDSRALMPLLQAAAAETLIAREETEAHVPPIFINATGLGHPSLVPDTRLQPNRGQTILVRGELPRMVTRVGDSPSDVLAIIPRPSTGTTIVGSTRGPGRSDLAEDVGERRQLLEEARALVPELAVASKGRTEDAGFEVVSVNVGLRPRREGGARVEYQRVEADDGDGAAVSMYVVHAYGHDGAGFQQSVGTAEKVRELVAEIEERLD